MLFLEKHYEMDMCSGPVLKKLLIFAIPLMFSGILQLLFNAADIVVVGRFAGDNSLAAVGSNTALINLLTNLFIGLSVGANVLAARYYGSGEQQELSKTVHTSMLISLYSGAILTVAGIIFAPQLLILMQTPENILSLAVLYLRILFVSMPALMIYNFGSALLRSVGDTKRPLYYLLFAGVINVILNLIFVIFLKLDVAGVALATVISQYISAYLVVRCLMHEQGGIQLVLSELKFDMQKFLAILRIGLPAGFQGVLFSFSNVVIQSSINLFGEIVVAGNSAAANIEGFVYIAMNTFYQAAITFVSQNLGAKQYKRIDRIAVASIACVIFTGILFGWTVLFFGRPLMSIYTDNPEVIEAGIERMSVIAFTYFLCGMMDVLVGVLRGLGCSVTPMIVSLIGVCGSRFLWLGTVFQMESFHTPMTIFLSYPISWILTIIVHVICLLIVRSKVIPKEPKATEA